MKLMHTLIPLAALVALSACGAGLSKSARQDVTATMQGAEPDLQSCYAKALERDAKATASMNLELRIVAKTGAFEPKVIDNTSTDTEFESCVVGVVSGLKLSTPQKAHIATSYPLEFQPN